MTESSVGKRHSSFPRKMSKMSFEFESFIGEHFRGPGFWSFFVWNDMSRSVCQWATLCLRKNLTLTEEKRQKSCTQRGLRRRFWWALWVLDYLQGGTRKPNKPTNVTGIKRGRGASASDYKQQIFRSHTQQSAAFLEGNTRMVFGLIS